MKTVRRADARMHTQISWLDSHHTFSFGEHHDPEHMSFGALRVINEDRVAPGRGFGTHPHRDMEILSYVIEGSLSHRDSMGNGSTIRPGDVQRMTAGTGVLHSEANPSTNEGVHFLQIWIEPEKRGLEPGYEQKRFDLPASGGGLRLVGERDGRDGAVTIHQDVNLYAARASEGETLAHTIAKGRRAWLQVVRGSIVVGGETLHAGDGLAIENESQLAWTSRDVSEVLLFDLA